MKHFKIYLFLILIPCYLFSQRETENILKVYPEQSFAFPSDTSRQLMAVFATMDRIGSAPFTVQFKDMSVGQPTRWTWIFGDGKTDSIKNPLHVYEQPGVYTVKLTVVKGNETSSITRNNYILVCTPGACDTVGYPLVGDYVLYVIQQNGSGYVAGNNSFGDLAKASYFNQIQNPVSLIGGIFDFAIARKSLASDVSVKFKAWRNDGAGQSPGTQIAEQTIPISQIVLETGYQWSTPVFFNPPPLIEQPFFLGVELPQQIGDTLALYTNADGDVPAGNGWEQHSNGLWYPYSDPQNSWNIKIDHAIFPLISYNAGVKNHFMDEYILIYPIPASDQLHVRILNPNLRINKAQLFTLSGERLIQIPVEAEALNVSLEIKHLTSGIYLLQLDTTYGILTRKISVVH